MRAVIFDLDGTLCDSAPDIALALNTTLGEAGLEAFDLAAVTAMVGAGARTLVKRAFSARGSAIDGAELELRLHRFVGHYHAHPCVQTTLYPGTLQMLHACRARGWRLAICTNKPEALALEVVAKLGLAALFDAVVGGRDGIALKPAANMVVDALARIGVEAGQAIFVGDSAADVGAARAAGLAVIVMAHGYCDGPAAALNGDLLLDGFAGFDAKAAALGQRVSA